MAKTHVIEVAETFSEDIPIYLFEAMAQAVFADMVKKRGFEEHFGRIEVGGRALSDTWNAKPFERRILVTYIKSSGTGGYHIGSEPDDRTVAKCREKVSLSATAGKGPRRVPSCLQGVPIDSYAQVVESRHFDDFDYLIGMDAQNVRNLQRIKPKNCKAQSELLVSLAACIHRTKHIIAF